MSQCFDDRIIGFLAGKTFHTLTTGDVPLAFITQVAAEEIDERSRRGFNASHPVDIGWTAVAQLQRGG